MTLSDFFSGKTPPEASIEDIKWITVEEEGKLGGCSSKEERFRGSELYARAMGGERKAPARHLLEGGRQDPMNK